MEVYIFATPSQETDFPPDASVVKDMLYFCVIIHCLIIADARHMSMNLERKGTPLESYFHLPDSFSTCSTISYNFTNINTSALHVVVIWAARMASLNFIKSAERQMDDINNVPSLHNTVVQGTNRMDGKSS